MTLQFPALPNFTGYNAPMRTDCEILDLEVAGEIPAEIEGTWYRCGPDPRFAPKLGDDIYVNGDGVVSMFRFHRGRVEFRMRHVRTERFLAEREAGRALFGAYRNPFTDDPLVATVSGNTANTTAFFHAGRLFALKEDGLPYELDPDTLETRGTWDFKGKLTSKTVTAHPKIDPATGEWLLFGYEADGLGSRDMVFGVVDKHGNLIREDWFEAPYTAMQHDFAVTQDYVIFMVFPTTADVERMRKGGDHWVWERDKESWIGILPRHGSVDQLRWFKRPAAYSFHVGNAYNEGSMVHMDLCLSQRNAFPGIPDADGAPYNPEEAAPFLTRWSFDVQDPEQSFSSRQLSPIPGELPRVDGRVVAAKHRVIYYGGINPELPLNISGPIGPGSNLLVRVDVESGAVSALHLRDADSFQEPQLVPAADHEGYLLVVVDHHDRMLASVAILEAAHPEKGPVATIKLPIRLRDAFHGCWVASGASNGA
ncbi:carotenoid oxygenase family protein [Pseudomonas mohnii]|uniref:carotenoid oxygenase family protein n=1 Tax=Pseudomonas sp. MIL9 TaxID=2807620 RepID=UPI00167908CD|nr:carotenoid oxygenase family protein [Pseudomonas sp. MIL9]MBM6443871.1 carotenoid oxygenase family protein [Pseudomonas sp. MIL9]